MATVNLTGLTWWTSDLDLLNICTQVGCSLAPPQYVIFQENPSNGKSMGIAQLDFQSERDATKFASYFKESQLHGRKINVEVAPISKRHYYEDERNSKKSSAERSTSSSLATHHPSRQERSSKRKESSSSSRSRSSSRRSSSHRSYSRNRSRSPPQLHRSRSPPHRPSPSSKSPYLSAEDQRNTTPESNDQSFTGNISKPTYTRSHHERLNIHSKRPSLRHERST